MSECEARAHLVLGTLAVSLGLWLVMLTAFSILFITAVPAGLLIGSGCCAFARAARYAWSRDVDG